MVRIIGGALLTFGILGLIWWAAYQKLPRQLDADGVTRRDGRRFTWAQLTKVIHEKTFTPVGSGLVDYALILKFDTERVVINPGELVNGMSALRFVEVTLGMQAQQHIVDYQRARS